MAKGRPVKQRLEKTKLVPKKSTTAKRKRVDDTSKTAFSKRARKSDTNHDAYVEADTIKVETREVDCDICAETKPFYRNFPQPSTCSHDATVCSRCYEKHFVTKIRDNRNLGWSACSCPLCGESVPKEDAQAILPRSVSKEIDTMIQSVELHTAENWIWCPAPNCGHGQLHFPGKRYDVKCKFCDLRICYGHQVAWHQGLTCTQYDRQGEHDSNVTKNLDEIERTTKACPHCKTRIKKEGGCNHMTCANCRKGWLWDTVPFDGEEVATSAETKRGPLGAAPLIDEVRRLVEQVITFENAQIDQNPRPPQGPPQQQRRRRGRQGRVRNRQLGGLAPRRQAARTIPTVPAIPLIRLDAARDVLAGTSTWLRDGWNATMDAAGRAIRTFQASGRHDIAGIFDNFAGQVRHPRLAAPPISNIRSTQRGPAQNTQLPFHPRENARTESIQGRPRSLFEGLDDSSGSDTEDEPLMTRRRTRQGRTDGSQVERVRQVVDLTVGPEIIDLTIDD